MSTTAKTSACKRIEDLLDDNSFVEIGNLVTARNTDFNMTAMDTPADGVITGYGTVNGSLVYVYSQDATVMNGSMGEMHAKKIVNIYNMALKMGAPVVGFVDCAGLRLQEATDALNAFGMIYAKQVEASGVIPQITAIMGTCGGGMAVMSSLSDFTFMESKNGKLFVNSPNTLDGNKSEDTAGVDFQSNETALVDFTGDEASIITEIRKNYAKEMVTGFIKLNGATIGVVANRTELFDNGESVEKFEEVLTAEVCEKAAEMINFCDAFEIPVLSLTNVKGFLTTKESEKKMAKAAAKLTYAFANADVPKVNLITGEAYGSAYTVMNSKAIGADVTYAWPDTTIGMMDASLAAKIIYEKQPELIAEKTAEYGRLQASAESAAKRGYVDSIIDPADTRKYLISAFEMLYSKRDGYVTKKHGSI